MSVSQLPNPDSEECAPFRAGLRVSGRECLGQDGVRFRYLSVQDGAGEEEEEEESDGEEEGGAKKVGKC